MSNIKEAEEQTGISRANIRYYEKMGLLQPKRNEKRLKRKISESLIHSTI